MPYPDCDKYPSCEQALNQSSSDPGFPNLIYVSAVGTKDKLHFVLTTINVPSLLILQTSMDGQMYFNWDGILLADNITDMANAINVSASSVLYQYSVLFTRVSCILKS